MTMSIKAVIDTCTPHVEVGEFMMEAMALSSAACVDRLGALSEMPCTLCVRLDVLDAIDVGCGELGTWLDSSGLLI